MGKKISKTIFAALFTAIILFGPASTESTAFYPATVGMASWYAEFSPGIRPTTANMEIFDDEKLTCAIWDIPFNTYIEVTNLHNGKTVIVRVNDRGPAKRLCREGRIIDLTKAAFAEIEELNKGLARVRIRIVE